MNDKIEDTLAAIERLFERAAKLKGIKTSASKRLEPATDAKIDALAKKFDLTIPDDVRRFWRRGFDSKQLVFDDGDGASYAGFNWYAFNDLGRGLTGNRKLATIYDAGRDERRVLGQGFPLTVEQPQLSWDPRGGLVYFTSRKELDPPFASSLAEFLEHWLESGCFGSCIPSREMDSSDEELDRWLAKVKHLVPGRIPPAKNLWLNFYKKLVGM